MDPNNSECNGGWMHRWIITKTYPTGVEERCLICKEKRFFHNKIPNFQYLSFHLRSALQKDNLRFYKEYASTETAN